MISQINNWVEQLGPMRAAEAILLGGCLGLAIAGVIVFAVEKKSRQR